MRFSFFPQNRIHLGAEPLRYDPTQIYLEFSELMNDPPGNSEASDVTNPVHYTLVRSATTPSLESCGLPGPEDELIPIEAVDFFGEIKSAVLNVPETLGPGNYRLIVCGNTGLQDLEGLAFDGDADKEPGGDYVVDFQILADTPLSNPHFDRDLEGWSTVGEGTVVEPSEADADGLTGSQSLALINTSLQQEASFFQCVDVQADAWYRVGTRLRNVADSSTTFPIFVRIEWYASAGCTGGEPIATFEQDMVFANTNFEWPAFNQTVKAPSEATSARINFGIRAGGGESQPLNWDDLLFIRDTEFIFSDGFDAIELPNWTIE